jgi:Contractile injection system tube protein/Phage P2 GpU
MGLTKATLTAMSGRNETLSIVRVSFNPSDLSFDQSVSYAEHPTLGAQNPIVQFVRAEGQTVNLELFLDGTTDNVSVADQLAELRQFVLIQKDMHAPPLCVFEWGDVLIKGVVKSLNEKYALFDQDGRIMRARVTMSLRRYEDPAITAREANKQSPDRTRIRVLREGETLAHIAQEAYGDPRLWTVIAAANNIDRPRFVPPGTPLKVPAQ